MVRHHLTRPPASDDATFLRRVSLDLIGLPPDEVAVVGFLADRSPDKRTRLVDRLLDDRQAYAEHWITLWNDLLRNDEATYILVTRMPITRWLFTRSSRTALTTVSSPTCSIRAKAARSASSRESVGVLEQRQRDRTDAGARTTSQVFPGVNLKCASCHDHFSNDWKLRDAWAFAGFFAPENLEPQRCDKPTGERSRHASSSAWGRSTPWPIRPRGSGRSPGWSPRPGTLASLGSPSIACSRN